MRRDCSILLGPGPEQEHDWAERLQTNMPKQCIYFEGGRAEGRRKEQDGRGKALGVAITVSASPLPPRVAQRQDFPAPVRITDVLRPTEPHEALPFQGPGHSNAKIRREG